MKKPILLVAIVLLSGLLLWQGYEKIAKPMLAPKPEILSPPNPEFEGNTIIGKVWDTEIQDKTSTPPTNNPPKGLLPPPNQPNTKALTQEAETFSGEEEVEWPLPPTENTIQEENSVEVGSPLEDITEEEVTEKNQNPTDKENPTEAESPEEEKPLQTLDPRTAEKLLGTTKDQRKWEELTDEERMKEEYEPTNIDVQRTFLASLPNGEKKIIRVKVPVVYKSRTLRLDETQVRKTQEIIKKAKELEKKLTEAKAEAENLLKEWNEVVRSSIPGNALLPESPSLPENQSAGELNRPNTNPDLTPGQAAVIEISQP